MNESYLKYNSFESDNKLLKVFQGEAVRGEGVERRRIVWKIPPPSPNSTINQI